MRHARMVVCAVLSTLLVACASQDTKSDASTSERIQISAQGYTADGCLFNLSKEAREQNLRLNLNEAQVDSSLLLLIFPFFNKEGYRCSGTALPPPRRQFMNGDVSLYPVY